MPCCRGGGDFIELPAEELSTIDRFSNSFSLSHLTGNLFENIIISLFSSGAQIENRNTTRAKEALEKDDEEGAGRRLLDRCDFDALVDIDVDENQHVYDDDEERRRSLDRYV